MDFDGSTVYTLWGYKPITTPAIKWIKIANGNWSGNDRGVTEDRYETYIVFKGPKTELQNLEDVLAANREDFAITCGTGEEIFGADIDYSGALTVVVVSYGEIRRVGLATYSMSMRLNLPSPTYIGSASLDTLKLAGHAYEGYSDYDIGKLFAMDRTAYYLDGETDPGIFKASFLQTTDEMKDIRRYLLTTARNNTLSSFDFSKFGVSEPFGQRFRGEGSSFNVKIIDWSDTGRENFLFWGLDMTFARIF